MAGDRPFADSNVFLYAYDGADPGKQARAQDLLLTHGRDLVISAQVMSEFFTVATRKLVVPLTVAEAIEAIARMERLRVVGIDAHLVRAGIEIHQAHQVSYWDGLVLAAARAAGCSTLLTEDLNAGATLAGVTIENPFASRA